MSRPRDLIGDETDGPRFGPSDAYAITAELLELAGLAPTVGPDVRFVGPQAVLASSFAVTTGAQALTAAFLASVAHLGAVRASTAGRVRSRQPSSQANRRASIEVDSLAACAAFQSERHLRTPQTEGLWDEFSGHYATNDGFIQFHTNFVHHRDALLAAVGCRADAGRAAVKAVVGDAGRFELEDAVTQAGGIAAALRSAQEWRQHRHARHIAGRAPLLITSSEASDQRPLARLPRARLPGAREAGVWLPTDRVSMPLAGLRVLDLTRVIAGPVCTRALAAYGADVLRIGAVDLPVVDGLLADTTLGKRFANCDITTAQGRDLLLGLAADADVIVSGFRPGALAGYGIDEPALREANPALVIATLSAFGSDGPWGGRRGFDSITQTATGIVAEETEAFGSQKPRPLPCQFLDHGTGYLLALGVVSALIARHEGRGAQTVEATLLTTRSWLESLGRTSPDVGHDQIDPAAIDHYSATRQTPFGPIRHITAPAGIEGLTASWDKGPSRPGADEPSW